MKSAKIQGFMTLCVCCVQSAVGFESTSHQSVCWLQGNGFSQSSEDKDTTNWELADSAFSTGFQTRSSGPLCPASFSSYLCPTHQDQVCWVSPKLEDTSTLCPHSLQTLLRWFSISQLQMWGLLSVELILCGCCYIFPLVSFLTIWLKATLLMSEVVFRSFR